MTQQSCFSRTESQPQTAAITRGQIDAAVTIGLSGVWHTQEMITAITDEIMQLLGAQPQPEQHAGDTEA